MTFYRLSILLDILFGDQIAFLSIDQYFELKIRQGFSNSIFFDFTGRGLVLDDVLT